MRRCARCASIVLLLLLASVGTAAAAWALWIETTEWIEPTDMRDVLRGEGLRGKKSWEREKSIYETLNACELELPRRINSRVEGYRLMGFTVVHPDEDGPSKFVRSGLAGSAWCEAHRGCVIAGSSGASNADGRERLTHHSFSCLADTMDPRGPKGKDRVE